jgi:hypothetical protein
MRPDTVPLMQLATQLRLPPLHQLPVEQCQRCREELPVFVGDEVAGLAVDDLYPETAVHLDICPACFYEYEALTALAWAALYGHERP